MRLGGRYAYVGTCTIGRCAEIGLHVYFSATRSFEGITSEPKRRKYRAPSPLVSEFGVELLEPQREGRATSRK